MKSVVRTRPAVGRDNSSENAARDNHCKTESKNVFHQTLLVSETVPQNRLLHLVLAMVVVVVQKSNACRAGSLVNKTLLSRDSGEKVFRARPSSRATSGAIGGHALVEMR